MVCTFVYYAFIYAALKFAGFEQLVKDEVDAAVEDGLKYSLKFDQNEYSLKVNETKRNRPILPDFNKTKDSDVFSPCNLMLKYFDLLDILTELLQFKEVLETLNNLMASEIHHIKLFSTDFIEHLKECPKAVVVLRALFPYLNWYDHSILRRLLKACNCSEGLKLLDEFDVHIDFTLPIKDYPLPVYQSSFMTPNVSSTHTVLTIRCEQQLSSITLESIKVVKSVILQTCDITDHACILLTATSHSSATLYWLIPQGIVSLICNKVEEHSAYLYDNKILEIAIYPDFTHSTSNINRISPLAHSSDVVASSRHIHTVRTYMYLSAYNYVTRFSKKGSCTCTISRHKFHHASIRGYIHKDDILLDKIKNL